MDPLRPEDLDISAVARSPLGHLKADSVEQLLQRAAWAYREALAENQSLGHAVVDLTQRVEELTRQVASLEEATARYKEREELTRTLLASAQRAAREERESARQEAELILKKAARREGQLEQKASRLEADRLSELARLEAWRDDTIARLRGTLEAIVGYGSYSSDTRHFADRPSTAVDQGEDATQGRETSSGGLGDAGQSALRDTPALPGSRGEATAAPEEVGPGKQDLAGEHENEHRENQPHWPEQASRDEHRNAVGRSRGRWAAFAAALVVITALVFFAVRARHHPSASLGAPSRTSVNAVTTPPDTGRTSPAKSRDSTAATTPVQPHLTNRSGGKVALTLRAVDTTWVEVRDASSTGRMLYSGLLSSGTRRSFRVPGRLWVRFGGAANLAVTLNGRPLRVPTGTYDAFFDAHGFRQTT
jgi:cell division septum initiation protein DivIVA